MKNIKNYLRTKVIHSSLLTKDSLIAQIYFKHGKNYFLLIHKMNSDFLRMESLYSKVSGVQQKQIVNWNLTFITDSVTFIAQYAMITIFICFGLIVTFNKLLSMWQNLINRNHMARIWSSFLLRAFIDWLVDIFLTFFFVFFTCSSFSHILRSIDN